MFVWAYDFVNAKQRYSNRFRSRVVEQALDSTVSHSARMQQAPISTVQDMHNQAMPMISEQLADQAGQKRMQQMV